MIAKLADQALSTGVTEIGCVRGKDRRDVIANLFVSNDATKLLEGAVRKIWVKHANAREHACNGHALVDVEAGFVEESNERVEGGLAKASQSHADRSFLALVGAPTEDVEQVV